RLLSTALLTSGGSVLDLYQYGYNTANQRTGATRADSSSVSFGYDKIGQLTVADSSVNTEDTGYSCDSAWNLHYRTNNGALRPFAVDNKNQLTSQPFGTCSYDANGNLITNTTQITYTYDDENRLTSV